MAREPKILTRLRALCGWLAAEHGIRADAEHRQDASGRWQWWLFWYDGPRELPGTSAKAEELGIDTRHLYQARVITTRALAIQATRIAARGITHRDVARLARQIRGAAESASWPDRPGGEGEAALADRLARLADITPGADPALAIAAQILSPDGTGQDKDALPAARAPGQHAPAQSPDPGGAVPEATLGAGAGHPDDGGAADPLAATMHTLAGLAGAAHGGGLDTTATLASLTATRGLAAELERTELALIEAARDSGATWSQIAAAMGARGRQGAQKRHADLSRRYPRPLLVDGSPQPGTPVSGMPPPPSC